MGSTARGLGYWDLPQGGWGEEYWDLPQGGCNIGRGCNCRSLYRKGGGGAILGSTKVHKRGWGRREGAIDLSDTMGEIFGSKLKSHSLYLNS